MTDEKKQDGQLNKPSIVKWSRKQLLVMGISTIILGLILAIGGLYEIPDLRHLEAVRPTQISPAEFPLLWTKTIIALKVFFYMLCFYIALVMLFIGFCSLRIRFRLNGLRDKGE